MGLGDLLLKPIQPKLDALETAFQRELRSDTPIISKINAHLAKQAGKRVRPTLLMLCAHMAGYKGDGDVTLGVAVEFIHTATLIHDDIIDNADLRRGQKSVNAIWPNNVTVLLGDYLYVKSMGLALRERSVRILDVLTQTTMALVEGELIELDTAGDTTITEHAYLDLIERKTAALFAACGRLAGVLAGLDHEHEEALAGYGHGIGMSFQLVDDMLDFLGDEATLGKPVVNDLVEGRVTLPIIRLIERAPESKTLVDRIIREQHAEPSDHAELLELMTRHGTLESTTRLADDYGQGALKGLSLFDQGPARQLLEQVPALLLARTS